MYVHITVSVKFLHKPSVLVLSDDLQLVRFENKPQLHTITQPGLMP